MRATDFVLAFCAVLFCFASIFASENFRDPSGATQARVKRATTNEGLRGDHVEDPEKKVTRRRMKRSTCGGPPMYVMVITAPRPRPRPRPVFPFPPIGPLFPISPGRFGGGPPPPKKPAPPPEDPEAKDMTYEQFMYDLAELEKQLPNLSPQEMANKLRMLVTRYDSALWKVMTNVNNPIPGKGKNVAPFDKSQNTGMFSQLTKMMDHTFKNGEETGVIKAGGEAVALGHVITGAAAGYDRQSVFGMDNLFATTISGDLGQSGLANSKDPSSPIIGPKGNWQNGKYMLPPGKAGFATHAEIIGDIDGFNIGREIQLNPNKPFSQHMKDYYNGPANRRWDLFKQNVNKATLTNEVYRFANLYEYKNDGLLSSILQSSSTPLAVRRALEIDGASRSAVQQFCTAYSSQLGAWCN